MSVGAPSASRASANERARYKNIKNVSMVLTEPSNKKRWDAFLARRRDPLKGGIPEGGKKGGSSTEFLSEVLSQICLAYAMIHNKEMHWSDIYQVEPAHIVVRGKIQSNPFAGDPLILRKGSHPAFKEGWLSNLVSKTLQVPTNKALWKGNSGDSQKIMSWGLGMVGGGKTWLEVTARNMLKLKRKYDLSSTHYVIWNDKRVESASWSPYAAYKRTGSKIDANKWNPADVWIINAKGLDVLKRVATWKQGKQWGLPQFNQFLVHHYKERNIIPVSLKKPKVNQCDFDVFNTDEYYHRIVLGKGPGLTFEYEDGNKDMKINFTIETIELPKGWTTEKAEKSPFNVPASCKVVKEQHVKLKYKTSGNQLELEMGQYSAALGGKMGSGNIRDVISQTSSQGVNKVKKIQNLYKNKEFQVLDRKGEPAVDSKGDPITQSFDLGKPDWFSTNQMGKSDPRKIAALDARNQELHDLFAEYVHAIWEEIGRAPNSSNVPNIAVLKDKFGKPSSKTGFVNARDFWYKARAGEMGLGVSGVSSAASRRRLVQNLYDLAASVGYSVGLTKTERVMAKATGDLGAVFKINANKITGGRKVVFRGGPFVKVY